MPAKKEPVRDLVGSMDPASKAEAVENEAAAAAEGPRVIVRGQSHLASEDGTKYWNGFNWVKLPPPEAAAAPRLPEVAPPAPPVISPDGTQEWDGANWVPRAAAPPAQPQLSRDGQFWWNGTQWQPVPSATATPAAASPREYGRGGPITILVSCGLVAIGSMLPWATLSGPFGISTSKSGLQGDGIFVLGAAVIVGIFAIANLVGKGSRVVGVLAILGSLLTIWIAATDMSGANRIIQDLGPGLSGELGPGLPLILLSAVVEFTAGIMACAKV